MDDNQANQKTFQEGQAVEVEIEKGSWRKATFLKMAKPPVYYVVVPEGADKADANSHWYVDINAQDHIREDQV